MKIANIHETKSNFEVLQTASHSQTAVMVLPPGGHSSGQMNVHPKSDQVLLVVEGTVQADVGDKRRQLHAGDVCLIPAGTEHRFENISRETALTFNVYSPPEYAPHERS